MELASVEQEQKDSGPSKEPQLQREADIEKLAEGSSLKLAESSSAMLTEGGSMNLAEGSLVKHADDSSMKLAEVSSGLESVTLWQSLRYEL